MTVPISSVVALIGPHALADLLGRIGRLADTGEFPPGIRLPPERALAAALAVSRNTVALAYQALRDDGLAESRQGSGTRPMPHRTTPAALAFVRPPSEPAAAAQTLAAVQPGASGKAELCGDRVPTRKLTTR